MVVALLRFELIIPHAGSLKEKRRVLNSLIDRTRTKFNVSVAEVADQDLWQRSVVAMALVSGETRFAREAADKVAAFVEANFAGEIAHQQVEIL